MAKKYSIQMEKNAFVSVQIDGVSYTNPDDIPDPQDRKQVRAMIARSADARLVQVFGRKKAAEFREMERQSAIFPRLIVAIFLLLAVLAWSAAAISTYSAVQQVSREQSAPGWVVDRVEQTYRDPDTRIETVYSYPVVEFTLPGQELPQKVQMTQGSSPPEYAVGDRVTVLYDPHLPENSRIKSFWGDLLLWLFPAITFFLGAAFAVATVLVIKLWPPD
jgi:hypothetical protein